MRPRPGTDRRPAGRIAIAALVVLLPTLLSACGGDPEPKPPSGTPSTTATTAVSSATRPEGRWTLVAWSVKRSDLVSEQRMARAILASMEPACGSGPCDLKVTPAGRNKTYGEPEAPPADGETTNADPITLKWNGTAYVGGAASHVVSCTPKDGTLVRNGYTTRSSWTLTFIAPSGSSPARVHGTIANTAKGTKASRAKGCTDFTETEAFGGVPTGSLDRSAAPTGDYDASISSTGSTPKALAPVGRLLWLGTTKVGGDASARTIQSLTGTAGPLTSGADGWSASPPSAPVQCTGPDGGSAPKGADGAEKFTAVHPIAMTRDGGTIFAGTWRLRANPNATGLAKNCSLAVYEGRLYLVPHGAGG